MALVLCDNIWAPDGFAITDQILIKLLNSHTIKRLRWIGQNGPLNHIPTPDGIKSTTTRYDHSVGAMILTLKIGGTIDEAIVALLHDIMHTAFSHTFDFLLESNATSYHEQHKTSLLHKFHDELQNILGNNWQQYFDTSRWPLIKKNDPFAIDIADYIARDGVMFGFCKKNEVHSMINHLSIDDARMLQCNNDWWTIISQKLDTNVYSTPWNVALNHYLACGIKLCGPTVINDLKNVTHENIETQTFSYIINNTEYGYMIINYHKHEFKFVSKIDVDHTKIGTFEIRHRIINFNPIIEKKMLTFK